MTVTNCAHKIVSDTQKGHSTPLFVYEHFLSPSLLCLIYIRFNVMLTRFGARLFVNNLWPSLVTLLPARVHSWQLCVVLLHIGWWWCWWLDIKRKTELHCFECSFRKMLRVGVQRQECCTAAVTGCRDHVSWWLDHTRAARKKCNYVKTKNSNNMKKIWLQCHGKRMPRQQSP